jgi:hypothetical protein
MIVSRDGLFHVFPRTTNVWNSLKTSLSLDLPLQSNVFRGLVHIAPYQLKATQAMRLHMLLAIVLA